MKIKWSTSLVAMLIAGLVLPGIAFERDAQAQRCRRQCKKGEERNARGCCVRKSSSKGDKGNKGDKGDKGDKDG